MMVKIVYFTLRVALLTSLWWAAQLTPAFAGGVVGTGTPASCTEAALDTALTGGGSVTFNCGAAPHTIILTDYKRIQENTELQGGGLITLSGGTAVSLFQVFSGKMLSLRDITLRQGNGTFGAVQNFGTLNLTTSQLISNTATLSGGAIENYGVLSITNSIIAGNTASQSGGGIYNDAGSVTIQGSDIYSNTAQLGGGIYNATNSSLSLNRSTLRGNSASSSGGGLFNDGTATLTGVTLNGNIASLSGGGLYNSSGTATLTSVTFGGNSVSSGDGGGLNNFGTANLTNATFNGNLASDYGGGLYNFGTANLTNATFSGNSAGDYGGGLSNYSIATLTHVTFSGNSAGVNGGGIYRALGAVTVRASIVVNSPSGGNCFGAVTNNGFNLSSDATCSDFNQVANVVLGSLANNGGQTQTHIPQPGSPAIDFVTIDCPPPATDQRGATRPVNGDGLDGAACDAGAVEYGAIVSAVYLPLVVK